ncbi:MAG: hypothetical protein ACR2QK_20215 [Acidimicrobiales bacterium]
MRTEDRRLLRDMIRDSRDAVLSLYVPVDPSDPRNQRSEDEQWWRIKTRSLLREIENDLARSDRDRYRAAIEQLEDFAELYAPDERSLAVFADGDTLLTVSLQVPVAPAGAFGRPLVGPLFEALFTHRQHHIIQVARDRIRVIEVAGGEAVEVANLNHSSPWQMGGQTRSGHRFRFEARREQYERQYHDRIADRLDRIVEDQMIRRIVLSGLEREAHGVLSSLSDRSREIVVGIVPAGLDEPPDVVADRVAPVVQMFVEEQEERAIEDVRRRRLQSGAGTVGLAGTTRALEMQVVRRLVLGQGLVDADAVEDLLGPAMSQGAEILYVTGPAKAGLIEFEGVIAELHFNPYSDRGLASA